MTLDVDLLDGGAGAAQAEAAWAVLEPLAPARLAAGWTWTRTWLEHYGDLVPSRFAIVRRDGVPCAVALVASGSARRARMPLRTLHLGTAGEPAGQEVYVQRNGLLVAGADRREVVTALLGRLRDAGGFHELRLDGFVAEDADAFAAADPSFELQRRPSPGVDLREAAERGGEALALLSSNTRYQVRRSLRAYGPVTCEWAETSAAALDIFDEMVELHQRRWQSIGEPGAFAGERQLAFHRALIERLVPARRVVLFRVRTAEATVGCLYSHIDGPDVLSYQLGLAESHDNKVKPGFVAHALCMQASHERGYEIYDFLTGGGAYKRELSTMARELAWGRGLARGAAARVADLLEAARRRVRPHAA